MRNLADAYTAMAGAEARLTAMMLRAKAESETPDYAEATDPRA